jgi:hypothetical protein
MRECQRKRENIRKMRFVEEVHDCAGGRNIPRELGVSRRKLEIPEEVSDPLGKGGVELEVQMLRYDVPA